MTNEENIARWNKYFSLEEIISTPAVMPKSHEESGVDQHPDWKSVDGSIIKVYRVLFPILPIIVSIIWSFVYFIKDEVTFPIDDVNIYFEFCNVANYIPWIHCLDTINHSNCWMDSRICFQ